jgi:hypothetical protein
VVELFLDLHGHSILKNSFIYGPADEFSVKFRRIPSHTLVRSLPYHLLQNSKYFRLASCKFRTEKENIETARVFFQLKEDILSFTCENSLGLYHSQSQTCQMLHTDWQAFGQSILRSMQDAFNSRDISLCQTSPGQQSKPHPRKQSLSVKAKLSGDVDKRMGMECVQLKAGTSKHTKDEKIMLRLPTANKSTAPAEQLDPMDGAFAFSQQINREDDFLQPKQFSYQEKHSESRDGRLLNMRRKS